MVPVCNSLILSHFTTRSPKISLWKTTSLPTARTSVPERRSPFTKTRVSGAGFASGFLPAAAEALTAAWAGAAKWEIRVASRAIQTPRITRRGERSAQIMRTRNSRQKVDQENLNAKTN